MSSYRSLIQEGEEALKETNSQKEVRLLMLELCREEEIDLYLHLDEEAKLSIQERFQEGIKSLQQEKPLSYILGYSWFYGYQLQVNEDVLIPRNETEELIGYILAGMDEHFNDSALTLFDVATGSGAIAIALQAEEPKLEVYASDISEKAVYQAKQNADLNHVQVEFMVGDMLEPFIHQGLHCDILVCNPPYIPTNEMIERSVKEYEPHLALFGGEDGLKFYHEVFTKAHLVLNEKAMMAFEMGYNQAEVLTKQAKQYFPNARIEVIKDLNGLDRMLFLYL